MKKSLAAASAGLVLAAVALSGCSSSESATIGDPTAIPEVTAPATPSAEPTLGQEAPSGQVADLQDLTLEAKTVTLGDKVTVDIDPTWFEEGGGITVIIDNRDIAEVDPKADPATGVMTFDTFGEGTTRVGITKYTEGTEPDLNDATFVGYNLTVVK